MNMLAVVNPATGTTIEELAATQPVEMDNFVKLAHKAQGDWAGRTAEQRADILLRWYNLIAENTEELARLLTAEQGKPIAEARAEISYANSFIKWFAAEAVRAYGLTIPSPFAGTHVRAIKEPVGVVAAITPWNFPAAMITRKVAPALAAGCSVIVKPSELTPLTALAIQRLAFEADVPEAVYATIVSADATGTGRLLTQDVRIAKISFTGSSRVGSILMAQSAPTVKRLSLELGGNAPFLVFSDACIDTAVLAARTAKLRNAGQTCVSANRFLVERSIAREFAQRLREAWQNLQIGDGAVEQTDIGPLINRAAAARVRAMISGSVAHGASTADQAWDASESAFMAPTIVEQVTPKMALFTTEVFGPVAPIIPFDTEDEAIALANATPFGLAAYLFTRDNARITRVTRKVACGMIGINTGVISNAAVPFGGCKQSGFGREGSAYGLAEYNQIKSLVEAY
jgi:succinate-semialdehyde dehydrogenase / glutarate-semialdehyde dehydrogenase